MAGGAPSSIGDGLRVIELAERLAVSTAALVLADHGADVIKVEPPGGDRARGQDGFSFWNRNKRSVVLDLSDPEDRERAAALCRSADVVLHASSRAQLGALGLDYATIAADAPGVVYCGITGYGPYEPFADEPDTEGCVAARTGRMIGLDLLSGGLATPKRTGPVFHAPPLGSFGAAQLAAQAILAALVERERTGRGDELETSLVMGASAFLMRQEMTQEEPDAAELERRAVVHRGIELCFLTARCQDDRYIQMCARQDHHFRNWLKALEIENVLDEPRYAKAPMGIATGADVDDLGALLRERMATRTQADWLKLFEEHDVGGDPFYTPAQFLHGEQMLLNDRVVDVDDPELGRVRQVGPLARFSATPGRVTRPAPRLGEHTDEVVRPPEGTDRLAVTSADRRPPSSEAPSAHTSARPSDARHPLAGVTIVEVAYFIAGPMATSMLAELGARVIKIEPIEGDPYRRTGVQAAKFLHGKESVAVDLKSEAGRTIVHELVATADAFVHSFRPGVVDRLGLDEATLRRHNPDLVYLWATSFGSQGPDAARVAFHSTGNAITGAGIIQAGAGNPPVDDSFPDPGAALATATALALGLYGKATGRGGQYVETSMIASTGHIMGEHMVVRTADDQPTVVDGMQHGFGPGRRLYRCAQGWAFVEVTRPSEEAALHDLAWSSSGDAELGAAVEALAAAEPAEAFVSRLRSAGVPAVVVEERPFDQWLVAAGLVVPESSPRFGDYFRLRPKVEMGTLTTRFAPAPGIGEDTTAVLTQLGRTPDEIAVLFADGVVAAPAAPGAPT